MHFLTDLAISKFHFGATKNAKSPQPHTHTKVCVANIKPEIQEEI